MFLPPLTFLHNYTTAMNVANQNIFQHNFVRKYKLVHTELLLIFPGGSEGEENIPTQLKKAKVMISDV